MSFKRWRGKKSFLLRPSLVTINPCTILASLSPLMTIIGTIYIFDYHRIPYIYWEFLKTTWHCPRMNINIIYIYMLTKLLCLYWKTLYIYKHNNFVSLYERILKLFKWTVNVKTLVKVNIFIVVKFSNQQCLEIIKNYYRNSELVVATLRALTPIFGRNNRPTRQAVHAIVDKFETKFTILGVPLQPWVHRLIISQISRFHVVLKNWASLKRHCGVLCLPCSSASSSQKGLDWENLNAEHTKPNE